jgi:hypothetical protein
MKCSVGLALLACVVSVSACSSEAPEAEPVAPHVSEPVTVQASDETKEQLGVVAWGADGANGNLHVAGYGSDGKVAFVVEQRLVMVDDLHHKFETTLTGREQARMTLAATMTSVDASGHFEIGLETTENTFLTSPAALNVLQHIEKDLETASGEPASTSLLGPKSVHPLEGQQLATPCSPLLRSCAGSLVRAAAPLVPCAMALVQGGSILLCAAGGFAVAGPIGALEAGAVCGIRQQGAVVRNSMECAERSTGIYNSWRQRWNDITSSCGSAASGCTGGGGGGVAMSSVVLGR